MRFSLPNIRQMLTKGLDTFNRFPLALLASLLTTAIALYFIGYEPEEIQGINLILAKLGTVAMLGVFVFTALRLLAYSLTSATYKVVLGFGVLGLIAYYLSLPDAMHSFDAWVYVLRHIFLIILFFVAVLWAPFLQSNLPNVDYWEYAKEVLFALVMTTLFSIVVIVGVNAALFAVEALFDFYIKGKYYFMIDVSIVGVFSVSYFLSQISKEPLASKAPTELPKVERFFTQYILTPLTGLYFIILYAYTAKVLVTMDWPKGILAWLIVAFSAVAVLTYLFWTHFTSTQNSKWRKWIWLAILLQTGMLFIAIGMRIEAYSWTENRYMVLLLGVWLAGISCYFLLFKEAKIKWIFISLSVLIAISQMGPFSAYAVSKNAQTTRLVHALESYKKQKVYGKNVPIKIRYEISDITQYLYRRYGIKALVPLFPKITADYTRLDNKQKAAQKALQEQIKQERKDNKVVAIANKESYQKMQNIFKDKPRDYPHFVTHELGFKFVNAWDFNNERRGGVPQNIYFNVQHPRAGGMRAQDIRGYDYMIHYYSNGYEDTIVDVRKPLWYLENIDVNIVFEEGILKILKEHTSITFDIKAFINTLVKKHGVNKANVMQKELTLEKENDTFKVKIEFQQINKNNYGKHKNINFNATLLFKMKGKK